MVPMVVRGRLGCAVLGELELLTFVIAKRSATASTAAWLSFVLSWAQGRRAPAPCHSLELFLFAINPG